MVSMKLVVCTWSSFKPRAFLQARLLGGSSSSFQWKLNYGHLVKPVTNSSVLFRNLGQSMAARKMKRSDCITLTYSPPFKNHQKLIKNQCSSLRLPKGNSWHNRFYSSANGTVVYLMKPSGVLSMEQLRAARQRQSFTQRRAVQKVNTDVFQLCRALCERQNVACKTCF